MDKIFHVFISSTFTDLIVERSKISEAVSKAGYVAEGMEIFPASSQNQMDFIQRIIDRCDYYILVLGARYGSVAEDGFSYTEKEYNYALTKGIPVLAFIHKDVSSISSEKADDDPVKVEKLDAFKSRLQSSTLVDFWGNADELATKSLAALSQARTSHPGVGWIRANLAASSEVLNEVNELRKINKKLNDELATVEPRFDFFGEKIAALDDTYTIKFRGWTQFLGADQNSDIILTWNAILGIIGPSFRVYAGGYALQKAMEGFLKSVGQLDDSYNLSLNPTILETILMQFEVLGLMEANTDNSAGITYKLTKLGAQTMLKQRVVKAEE